MINIITGSLTGADKFVLMRLLEWSGIDRDQLIISDSKKGNTHVRVPLGEKKLHEVTGLHGIENWRGYVIDLGSMGTTGYAIPSVEPSYIRVGNSRFSAVFINDIQKAELLSRGKNVHSFTEYLLDPTPGGAVAFAQAYLEKLQKDPSTRLAFDIETPYKADEEEENDSSSEVLDRTWNIDRIGFSFEGLKGLSIEWKPEMMQAIRLLMGSPGEKVVWNLPFDVPRIRRAGVEINGFIHDGMIAWHVLHSDLPKSLRFVATFTCPWQPAWKHLSHAKPAFYNVTDADVELRSMEVIEKELKETGLWDVYKRDVIDLQPVLDSMQNAGMPIDREIRVDRAVRLSERMKQVSTRMTECVPLEARRIDHVYKGRPKDVSGLSTRAGKRVESVCSNCGLAKPRKDHFKGYVKKCNPCDARNGARSIEREIDVVEYYRLGDFKPSRDQLERYHRFHKRPLPMQWDKKARSMKVSFSERNIKKLILAYPNDELYGIILDYRSLEKIAGTYIGRPVYEE